MIKQLFRYVISNGFLLLMSFALKFGVPRVTWLKSFSVPLGSIANFILLVLITNFFAFLFSYLYRKKNNIPFPQQDTIIAGVKNLYFIFVSVAGILLFASFFGISIRELITSLSIVAAAIAIISKEFIAAIISGFIMAFSKMLNINDYVQIGSYKGKIIDMTITKIHLLNEDDDLIIISNDKVYNSELINYTRGNIRRVSIPFTMDSQYLTTVEELEESLIKELYDFFEKIDQKSFNLRVSEVKKDSIEFKFQYTLNEVDRLTENAIRRKTTRKVINYLKEKSKGLTNKSQETLSIN